MQHVHWSRRPSSVICLKERGTTKEPRIPKSVFITLHNFRKVIHHVLSIWPIFIPIPFSTCIELQPFVSSHCKLPVDTHNGSPRHNSHQNQPGRFRTGYGGSTRPNENQSYINASGLHMEWLDKWGRVRCMRIVTVLHTGTSNVPPLGTQQRWVSSQDLPVSGLVQVQSTVQSWRIFSFPMPASWPWGAAFASTARDTAIMIMERIMVKI